MQLTQHVPSEVQRRKALDFVATPIEFHFGQYTKEGSRIMSQESGQFMGFGLLYGLIVLAGSFMLGNFASLLTVPLSLGFHLVAYDVDERRPFEFGRFFEGLNYFTAALMPMLAVFGVALGAVIVLFVPFAFLGVYSIEAAEASGSPPALFITAGILLVLLLGFGSWGVQVFFANMLLCLLLVTQNFKEAFRVTMHVMKHTFRQQLGFSLLLGLINFGGALLLLFGLAYTGPLTMCMRYAAFRDFCDQTGIGFEADIDKIGEEERLDDED